MTLMLVVDDDPVISIAVQNLAAVLGHDVVTADSVSAALDLLRDSGDQYDHVVLDHDLPDGTGREVAMYLAVLQPGARVIMHTSRTLTESPFGVDQVVRKVPGLVDLMDVLVA